MSDLRAMATSPTQYDGVGADWLNEGGRDTPWRVYLSKVLAEALGELDGRSVLDVGCGTGWLSEVVLRLGAGSYLGLDPSRRNYEAAVATHAGARFVNTTFEDFSPARRFHVVCCVMSTEHIADLDLAFARFRELLEPGGRLLIVSGDPEAHVTERFDYSITVERVSDDEAVVQTLRPRSVDTVDIIRSPSAYVSAAARQGLKRRFVGPLEVGDDLIELAPQYEPFRSRPLFQLMVFDKVPTTT